MTPRLPSAPAATTVAAGVVLAVALTGCASADPSTPRSTPTETPVFSPAQPEATAGSEPTTPDRKEQQRLNDELIAAAWDDDVQRARRLVRAGADVNRQDDTQQSAYLIAASEGYVELLEVTLRHGAKVNDKDSYDGTALIRAAERGHAAVAGRLVQAGIDLDHVNNLGWTALHEAVILGGGTAAALRTVRTLVAAGVDVTIPTGRDGLTALQHAERRGYGEIAGVLRAADRQVPSPREALLRSAASGDADGVALALHAGAGLEVRDADRRTPLLLAVTGDHLEAARLLIHLGADPDVADHDGVTPIEHAQSRGFDEIARILRRHS